ncbi:MAG: spore maturation protein [Verrucomicrobia bacterium]|nr:spore maturation protein [Verrucomicrobiota bacterium]
MLNVIWVALLLGGVCVAACTGRFDAVSQGVLTAAKSAVMDIALPLVGAMALWLGLMRLAEKSGLIQRLGRAIRPVMLRLFPDVPPDHPAIGAMMMNISANMLGVSNAATPLGLKAMTELNRLNSKPGVATNAMCVFLAINTSSIQLIPATAINLLSINGSKNPTAIVASTLLSTGFAAICAIITVKILERLGPFRWERQKSVDDVYPADVTGALDQSSPNAPERGDKPCSRWLVWLVYGLFILFVVVFIRNAFPYFFGAPWPPDFVSGLSTFLRALSPLAIPFVITFFPLYALTRGVSVYGEFVEGAKEGFQTAVRIIPYLVAMLVAIAVFRESGALDLLQSILKPLLGLLQIPAELLPIVLMRPLSGSGSLAVLSDIIKRFGPDNLLSYTAATIYGSAETTFYVIAVYFGSVGITRIRHAIFAGLLADLAGAVAAVFVCRMLLG